MVLEVKSGPVSLLSHPSFGELTENLPREQHSWFWKADSGPDAGVGEHHVGGGGGDGTVGLLPFQEADSPRERQR